MIVMTIELVLKGNWTTSSGDTALNSYTITSSPSNWSSPNTVITRHLKNSPVKFAGMVRKEAVSFGKKSTPSVAVVRLESSNSNMISLFIGWLILAWKHMVAFVLFPVSGSSTVSPLSTTRVTPATLPKNHMKHENLLHSVQRD